MEKELRRPPEELKFIVEVDTEIARDNYEKALSLFMDGIKNLVTSKSIITEEQFKYHLSDPVSALVRFKLRQISTPSFAATAVTGCSFCGKDETKVARLIAGAGVFICDGCVEICNHVIDETNG